MARTQAQQRPSPRQTPTLVSSRAAPRNEAPPPVAIGLDSPERFINRELSWLDFNTRVVEEAENTRHPLLERLRFVSISAANLDEFFSVRVAGLIGQAHAGVSTLSPDGLTPAQQLSAVNERARTLLERQQKAWKELCAALNEAGIAVVKAGSISDDEKRWLDAWFMERGVPNPDAARDRPRTSLPVHPQHGPRHGVAVAAQRRRDHAGPACRPGYARADPAAGTGRSLHPPARTGRHPLRDARRRGHDVSRPRVSRFPRGRRRHLPTDTRYRHRVRGRSRRPRAHVRDGIEEAPSRIRHPSSQSMHRCPKISSSSCRTASIPIATSSHCNKA